MLEKVISRILQSSLLDFELQTTATEILSLRTKDAAGALFDLLNKVPNERVTTNILNLFKELAIRSSAWSRIIQKSISKKGRCPKQVIPIIKEMLLDEKDKLASNVISLKDILSDFDIEESRIDRNTSRIDIEREFFGFLSNKRRITIPLSTELSHIEHMEDLASSLCSIDPLPDELILDFKDVDHLYVAGLTAIIAWCKTKEVIPQLINANEATQKYLDIIGFSKVSSGGISPYSDADVNFQMAIERINTDTKPELVSKKIVDIIDSQMPIGKQVRASLIVVFAELIENTQRHAGNPCVAYACAQVYPKKHKLTFCLVDMGIGIHKSFSTSSNEEINQRIENGESAVRLACAPLVTSKPGKHTGYGLYVASDLVVRNGGTFRIFSGNEIFTLYRNKWRRVEHFAKINKGWNGTWIAMIFDLNSSISIEDVYLTLPPSQGTEMEDYF
jgi:anti-anti-sigma regulatory factor